MAKGTFEEMIEKERERLNGLRQDALSRRDAIDGEIEAVDIELRAISAYEEAKTGKRKNGTTRSTRTLGRRDAILALVAQNSDGISRGDILDGLGVKGNKSAEQSVSNALNNLKKANKLAQRDGKYIAA